MSVATRTVPIKYPADRYPRRLPTKELTAMRHRHWIFVCTTVTVLTAPVAEA